MSLEITAVCDMCNAEQETEDRLPEGWAEVMFKFRSPADLPAKDRRPKYHVCEKCSFELYKFLFGEDADTPGTPVKGNEA